MTANEVQSELSDTNCATTAVRYIQVDITTTARAENMFAVSVAVVPSFCCNLLHIMQYKFVLFLLC